QEMEHVTGERRRLHGVGRGEKPEEEEKPMCRNIRTLANFDPPATEEELRDEALQFVRKLSGTTRPSRANQAAFDRAVDEIAAAAEELISSWKTNAPPRNRDVEREKLFARSRKRFGRDAATA